MDGYEKPELVELGRLHDVTGGLLDNLIEQLLGGGSDGSTGSA